SGLSERSGGRPYELKEEMSPAVAAGAGNEPTEFVHVILTGPPASRLSINTPSVTDTATTGIVIAGVPATVGLTRPGALLYSTTAAAPAFIAFEALMKNEQV